METFIKNISSYIFKLNDEWDASEFKEDKPDCLLAVYDKSWYFVVSDKKTIVYLISGQKNIYAVVKSKCKKIQINGVNVYQISDTPFDTAINKKAVRPISCTSLKVPSEVFASKLVEKLIR